MKNPNQEGTPQRTATRAPIDKPIRLQFDDAIEVIDGHCLNISIGGIFVEMAGLQPHGSLVRFELLLDEELSIRGLGEVVWARPGDRTIGRASGLGIKFRFLEQRDRQRIFKLVSQHIKDRLANRPSMTASPEGPSPVIRSGMIFRPPEGEAPLPDHNLPEAPAIKPGHQEAGAPAPSPIPNPSPQPRHPLESPPPAGSAPSLAGPAEERPPIPELGLGAPTRAPEPLQPTRPAEMPGSSLPVAPTLRPEPALKSPLAPREGPVAQQPTLPPVAPPPESVLPPIDLDSIAGPMSPPGAPAVQKESVLEALPPLGQIEPEIPDLGVFAELPQGERRLSAPPDDEPTLSSWSLEDASLDPPAPGSVLPDAESLIGPDPALLPADFQPMSDLPGSEPISPPSWMEPRSADSAAEPEIFSGTEDYEHDYDDYTEGKPPPQKRLVPLLALGGLLALVTLVAWFFVGKSSESSEPEFSEPAAPTVLGEKVNEPVAEEEEPSASPGSQPGSSEPDSSQAAGSHQSEPRQTQSPAPAPPAPRSTETVPKPESSNTGDFRRLIDISWEPAPGGLVVIFLTDGAISRGKFRHFRLGGDPAREVIQLVGVNRRFAKNQLSVGGPGVEQLRIGFHKKSKGDELHIVFDMQDASSKVTEVNIVGRQLRVRVETSP